MTADRRGAPWLVVLPVVAMLSWSAWVVGDLTSSLPALHSWTSELGARDQPHGWVFRLTDAVAGALLLGWAALGLRRRVRPLGLRSVGLVAAGVFGVATLLDAGVPMSCAPTVDTACHAAEAAGSLPWQHYAHSVTSSVAGTSLMVAATAFSLAAWRHDRVTASALLALLAAMTLTLLWQLLCLTPGEPGEGPWLLAVPGLAQRAQLVATVGWWVVFVMGPARAVVLGPPHRG